MKSAPMKIDTSRNTFENVVVPDWMVSASRKIRGLLESIAAEFHVDPVLIMSESRNGEATLTRQVAYWVLRHGTSLSLVQIANRLNRFDHTSSAIGIERVELKRKSDERFRLATDRVLMQFVESKK